MGTEGIGMLRTIKGICVFLAAAVLLQGLALLLLTPAGLEKIHPFFVRVHAEKFDPSTNTYAVYYDTRTEIAAADLVVIGMDGAVAESYDILGHFTRFVKQYNNFSAVMMNLTSSQRMLSNSLLSQTVEDRFERRVEALHENAGTTVDFTDYFTELFIINRTMTGERKFDILSYSELILNEIGSTDGMTGADWADAVAGACRNVTRSAVCAVDSRLLEQNSGFREALADALPDKKIVFIQTWYDDGCASSDTHSSFAFPVDFEERAVYFVDDSRSDGFYDYYSGVALIPGGEESREDPLDTRYTDYYFVVSGGTLAE